MTLLSPDIINRSAKKYFDYAIFRRGEDYFQRGRVKNIDFEISEDDKTVLVTAKVRGSRSYESSVTFNAESGEILDATCTCPYDDACKHCVATALAFAEKTAITKVSGVNEVIVKTALKNMGISVEKMPADLLNRILDYQEETQKQPRLFAVPKKVLMPKIPKPPQPKKFFIKLSHYPYYAPSLYNEDNPHQPASLKRTLDLPQITTAQCELLLLIQEGNFQQYSSAQPDYGKLLPLLAKAEFPVYRENIYTEDTQLDIVIDPSPLQATLKHYSVRQQIDKTKVRHDFYLEMPAKYWKTDESFYGNPFLANNDCAIRDTGTTLELHRLSPLLAKLIARARRDYYSESSKITPPVCTAELTGDEVAQYEQLTADVQQFLKLSAPLPPLSVHVEKNTPRPVFLAHFNNAEQEINVAPAIDYGFYQQDISKDIYLSRRKYDSGLKRVAPWEHPGTHIVDVKDNIIHVAEINADLEINLFSEIMKKNTELGFSEKLRCKKIGTKPLENYLRDGWPKVLAYANEKGYGIIFTQDTLPTEEEIFRADFASQINADNDWLYFDLKCYCGEEKVTLEKLLEFLNSGQKYWKKDDGTLVNVANREELERLARLLESFHAKENGGFEGRLHHAAELEYVMTSSPHYNAVREESFNSFIQQLHRGKPVKKVRLSNNLNAILRPYQKEGIEWLYFLRSFRFAGILADDMGLGKTLQTLVVIDREKISGTPSLVICPKTLLYNWQAEAKKFFPSLKTLVYDGTPTERKEKIKLIKNNDLVITGYATIKRDFDEINREKIRFNYAILDEAQFIKNHATKSAQVVKKIDAGYRLALTGTPLENSVSEIWSIYDFLMPGFLGNYKNFAENFHRPIMDHGDREALEHLRKKVEKFMLRRTKTEVLKELPPKIEQETQCHLSDAQNILYQQILSQVRNDIFKTVKTKGFNNAQIHILAGLTKLRQVCNHPALLIKEKDFRKYESAKLEMCLELVNEVVEGKRKLLIFSQFTKMLDIISASLKDTNTPHLYLSGKTKDRQTLVDRFNNDPAFPVFLISLKAGGVGLNLTSADTVIIFDPWWNPSVENQAIDRTHRIGQTKTVNVYRLLTSGTIEEKIQALKQKKQRLFNAMVSQSGDTFKKLTWNDVKQLFE
ncbi:MAG: DEAD/DEAH box helicase [bacterium]|nr:DEAD/DEAH box helicase [bacterium]